MQASTKPGMEGVQETAGKIAVERKLQDEVLKESTYFFLSAYLAGGTGVQHIEAAGGDEDQWKVCQADGHAGERISFAVSFLILIFHPKDTPLPEATST